MRVDFYQLGDSADAARIIGKLAAKVIGDAQRLLVVAEDEALLARLERQLWEGDRTSFLPHGLASDADEPRQPILLSTGTDAANGARNLLIADGQWREAAQHFDRTFYVFGQDRITEARAAWKALAETGERHYWANDDGKWVEKA